MVKEYPQGVCLTCSNVLLNQKSKDTGSINGIPGFYMFGIWFSKKQRNRSRNIKKNKPVIFYFYWLIKLMFVKF